MHACITDYVTKTFTSINMIQYMNMFSVAFYTGGKYIPYSAL